MNKLDNNLASMLNKLLSKKRKNSILNYKSRMFKKMNSLISGNLILLLIVSQIKQLNLLKEISVHSYL
jgi:hypothetical protein